MIRNRNNFYHSTLHRRIIDRSPGSTGIAEILAAVGRSSGSSTADPAVAQAADVEAEAGALGRMGAEEEAKARTVLKVVFCCCVDRVETKWVLWVRDVSGEKRAVEVEVPKRVV